jgi:putative hemolysin
MSLVILQVAVIALLTLANGFLAMSETAIVSARRTRLQRMANEGDARAASALRLVDRPNQFLATTQIGITLAGVLAGALGGATLAEPLALRLRPALPGPYADAAAVAGVALLITYASLVVGELVPKRLALNRPERIAAFAAGPMQLAGRLGGPAVRLLSVSTELVLRMMRIRLAPEPPVTEEEIKLLIEQGTQAGVFGHDERRMVMSVFRLYDRDVGAVMTPRPDIVWLDIDEPQADIWRKVARSGHSNFPVCRGDLDNVQGVLSVRDLWALHSAGQKVDLESALHSPLFVPESMPAWKLPELFRSSGAHMALVIDEFGGVQGLATLHDILEAIAGEIPSLGEEAEARAIQREDGSWLVDGLLPIDEFKELFKIRQMPGEDGAGYQTLGGFVLMYIGHIPSVGQRFEWDGLRFEVVDMDGHRVDKVLVVGRVPNRAP